MNNPALNHLRNRTASLHQRLDKHSSLSRLISTDCTIDDYKMAMAGLALAYKRIDAVFIKAARHCPDGLTAYQTSMPVLENDLVNLGLSQPDQSPPFLSPPNSDASYLGMRYVIEGSNLGAAMIRRKLLQSGIAKDIESSCRFWTLKTAKDHCWPNVITHLGLLRSHADIDQACKSASRTFSHFIKCLAL